MRAAPVTTFAPGKLFLMGEYAVLDGMPALVAAVQPYVKVRAHRRPATSTVRISAPQIEANVELPATSLPRPEGPLRFVLACLHVLGNERKSDGLAGLDISLEAPPAPSGTKLGLGFSAAISVATTASILALDGDISDTRALREDILRSALTAHRLAQQGRGSGADVAASVLGGVIWFTPRSVGHELPPTIERGRQWQLVAAWTGTAATTTDLISRYQEACQRLPTAHRRFLQDTAAAVEQCRSALEQGHDGGMGEAFALALTAVRRFSRSTGFSPLTPPVERAMEIAWRCGVPAKWSGAGGGDCVIALASNQPKAQAVLEAWREAGLYCWAPTWATAGVYYG